MKQKIASAAQSQWGGEEYFTCSNDFYLPSQRLAEWGGVGILWIWAPALKKKGDYILYSMCFIGKYQLPCCLCLFLKQPDPHVSPPPVQDEPGVPGPREDQAQTSGSMTMDSFSHMLFWAWKKLSSISPTVQHIKGTQDWEFFLFRFWNLRYFFVSYA